MPAIPAADAKEIVASLAAAAADLAKATANHHHIVATEAKKIGDRLGVGHAKAAAEQIKDKDAELRRAADLVRELRRQMKPLVRHSDALVRVKQAIAGARKDGAAAIDIDYVARIIDAPAMPDEEEASS